jgi:Arylsulfotransferase (ASST)
MPIKEKKSNVFFGVLLIVLCFLSFSIGGLYVSAKPGNNIFLNSWLALKSIYYVTIKPLRLNDHLLIDPRVEKSGVTINNPEKVNQGLTIVNHNLQPIPQLIDMKGKVVHEWDLSLIHDLFKFNYIDQTNKLVRDVHLFPNGDIIAVITHTNATPWGAGIVKVDKDGNLLWSYDKKQAHHDIDIDDSGNIYLLTHRLDQRTGDENLFPSVTPVLDDMLTILDKNGNEIKSIPLLEALFNSSYSNIKSKYEVHQLFKESISNGSSVGGKWVDPVHSNTVQYVTEELAESVDFLKKGDVLINSRSMNVIMAIDPEKGIVTWAIGSGSWDGPHDIRLLPNGHIMMLDNKGKWPNSRVIEIDPKSLEVIWEYIGTLNKPFYTEYRGRQQPLENGNVLITESDGGRLLEVSRSGNIVWEYSNPSRIQKEGKEKTFRFLFGYRYPIEELFFLNSDTSTND